MSQDSVPSGIDTSTPSVARMYDYYLGGKDHFASDREAAEQVLSVAPDVQVGAQENRAFLGRVVRYLAGAGVRQFIDLGTGLPTQNNVHEVAQRIQPDVRVVYVDNDPVVLAHGNALLATDTHTTVIPADMRRPEDVIDHPETRGLIDFHEPVAVLLLAALHLVPDSDEPVEVVSRIQRAVPSGSYLAISHFTCDNDSRRVHEGVSRGYDKANSPAVARTRAQISLLFDGFSEMLEPGLVYLPEWRPEDPAAVVDPYRTMAYAGLARKP